MNAISNRILVVDDEHDMLTLLKTGLSIEGYTVMTADNAKDGLKIARQEKPDLIILDVMMPETPGGSVGLTLQEDKDTRDIPIMFLSCIFAESHRSENKVPLFGDNVKMAKPYDMDRLLEVVKDLCSGDRD